MCVEMHLNVSSNPCSSIMLAMKDAIYYASVMWERGFEETFKCIPMHIDNTLGLHVARNKTYSSRAKHVALRLFYVRELIQESKIGTHYILTELS